MRSSKRHPEDIKDILSKVIGTIEKKQPGKRDKIIKSWKQIVGEKAAGHSRPVGIRRKVLNIEIDSSTWFYALNLKKRSILKDIKKELKEYNIENIRFRMGDIT